MVPRPLNLANNLGKFCHLGDISLQNDQNTVKIEKLTLHFWKWRLINELLKYFNVWTISVIEDAFNIDKCFLSCAKCKFIRFFEIVLHIVLRNITICTIQQQKHSTVDHILYFLTEKVLNSLHYIGKSCAAHIIFSFHGVK